MTWQFAGAINLNARTNQKQKTTRYDSRFLRLLLLLLLLRSWDTLAFVFRCVFHFQAKSKRTIKPKLCRGRPAKHQKPIKNQSFSERGLQKKHNAKCKTRPERYQNHGKTRSKHTRTRAKAGLSHASTMAKPGPSHASTMVKTGRRHTRSVAKPGLSHTTTMAKPGLSHATTMARPGLSHARSVPNHADAQQEIRQQGELGWLKMAQSTPRNSGQIGPTTFAVVVV